MSLSAPGTGSSVVAATLAKNRLGVRHIVFFVATAAAPLTVIAGIVSTGWAVTEIEGIPLAFLMVGVVLALFCVGYVAVARRIRNAGAFYTYVARGLGKPLGVGASFVAVVAYGMMQVATYGALGPATATLIRDKTGTSLPWWLIALVAWAFVAVMGVNKVELNGRVLATALVAEVALVVVYDLIDLAHGSGGRLSVSTLTPHSLAGGGLGVALAIAVTGFIGFEAAAVFSEESRDSDRTVPLATYLSLALMTLLYAGSAWAMSVAIGPANLHQAAQQEGTNLPFTIVAQHLGSNLLVDLGQLLFISSLLAAALSYHSTVARYMFALGRERVLPGFLGRTGVRSMAPTFASMTQSTAGLFFIAVYAISGADPVVKLFYWFGTVGGFGVLLLITGTSISVIGFLHRHPAGESVWQRLVAPMVASAGLVVIVYLILHNFAGLLSVDPTSRLRYAFPIVFAVFALAGLVWALILRRVRPRVYAAIGLGTSDLPEYTSPAYTAPAKPVTATRSPR
ncbi:APC family permease [Rugosimonospora africana]|uniref:Amino acid permease n=1 Tax=Rugosimonospora africana TaxID=556532 RepID=A0A8J3QRF2_9ACTN|nr:APC family permease [Rugosimonospora africana]GIH16080.1 amino acid permease [Rugosimonospora africana]